MMFSGERLSELREEHGITQDQLGEVLGVSRNAVCSWEGDSRAPKYDMLDKIADYFGVSTDYLLGRTDIRYPYDVLQNGDVSLRIKCRQDEAPAPNGAGAETRTISLDAADLPQSPAELLIECFRQIAREELEKAMQGK